MRAAILTSIGVGFATSLENGVVSGVLVGGVVLLSYFSGRQDGQREAVATERNTDDR